MTFVQFARMHKQLPALIICMMLMAGCSLDITPTPASHIDLLSDSTCARPCILGITPGKTTQSEAWTIVKNNKFLSDCSQQDLTSQGGVRWIQCDSKSFNVVFFDADDIVDWIAFATPNLTLQRLIQKYGPPDALEILGAPLPDEPVTSKPLLVYNIIRAEVTLIEKPGNTYEVTPNSQVEAITFNSESEQAHITALVPSDWKGYGVYSP